MESTGSREPPADYSVSLMKPVDRSRPRRADSSTTVFACSCSVRIVSSSLPPVSGTFSLAEGVRHPPHRRSVGPAGPKAPLLLLMTTTKGLMLAAPLFTRRSTTDPPHELALLLHSALLDPRDLLAQYSSTINCSHRTHALSRLVRRRRECLPIFLRRGEGGEGVLFRPRWRVNSATLRCFAPVLGANSTETHQPISFRRNGSKKRVTDVRSLQSRTSA